jgi:hypothetical protein
MKTQFFKHCFSLFSIVMLCSFTTKNPVFNHLVPQVVSEPESCYLLTNEQAEKMGGAEIAGNLPEAKVQAFYSLFGITPITKDKLLQHSTGKGSDAGFVCNTTWTYFYSYGSCSANYNRPECGYYVRVRYWKRYRFNAACQYEEVTLSTAVVCC